MNWQKRSPEEKLKWLNEQMAEIRRAQSLLERWERVTQKWARRIEAAGKKPTN